ncbi:MAG: YbaK/EbsC family protein [Clostridia bacterium]|nr:YbaK/EbsC family protein [Clostridia bacterium]
MAYESARAQLARYGFEDRITLFDVSSATVELAAQAVGCDPAMIAKTLSFDVNGTVVLILAAGDAKIDNPKYKAQFGAKAKMLSHEEAEPRIGHAVGGVCPFGVNEGVKVYLDISLKRFEIVYPACGTANSAVRLTPDELEVCAQPETWIDVCKNWQ